jgi:hypothetical protein
LLMRKFNYTQAEVARALGRKESTISEDLSVLKLPEDIRKEKKMNSLNPFVFESEDGRFTVTARFSRTWVTREVLMDALRKAYLSVKHSKEGMEANSTIVRDHAEQRFAEKWRDRPNWSKRAMKR